MSSLGVGKEVLSLCNKCKLTLAHIIVTMKTDKVPHKVQCKTCNGTHSFKDATLEKIKKSGSRRVTKKKTGPAVADLWQAAVNDPTKEHHKYSPRTAFHEGDVIEHPTFGAGLIEKLIDHDKIQVIFRSDIKTLIHNK
jgi:hypothetical protein